MKNQQRIQTLILLLFGMFWLFVFISPFISNNEFQDYRNQSAVMLLLFPPTYKMYTEIPTSIYKTEFTFYKNEKVILKKDLDSYYRQNLKQSKSLSELKKWNLSYTQWCDTKNLFFYNQYDSILNNVSNIDSRKTLVKFRNKSLKKHLIEKKFFFEQIKNKVIPHQEIDSKSFVIYVKRIGSTDSINIFEYVE